MHDRRQFRVEKLSLVDADDFRVRPDLLVQLSAVETFVDGIFISLCETISSSLKRLSIAGLKICTCCFAICARRSRRISSSLLPLNMLPVMTSIHPGFGVSGVSMPYATATGTRRSPC